MMRGSSSRAKASRLTSIGGSLGLITLCQTGASWSLQSMNIVFMPGAVCLVRFTLLGGSEYIQPRNRHHHDVQTGNFRDRPVLSLRIQRSGDDERKSMMQVTKSALIGLALTIVLTVASFAQQPGRIRGQIEKADGEMVVLRLRDGSALNVRIAQDARISALTKATLADLKNDTFVGIAGVPRPDDSIEAYSIHIFLPAQRGVVADRHGPWDGRPNSTMTNAYIEGVPVAAANGNVLKVKYKDGEKTVIVTSQTAIAA